MSGRVEACFAGEKVVGVDLSVDAKNGQGRALRQGRTRQEPLPLGPGAHDGLGVLVRSRHVGDLVESAIDENGPAEGTGGLGTELGIVEQADERSDVVAAEHRAQEGDGFGPGKGRRRDRARSDAGEPFRFDLGRGIHPRRNPVAEEGEEIRSHARRRGFEEPADLGRLFGAQGQGWDAQSAPFFLILPVRFQHDELLGTALSRPGGAMKPPLVY